MARAGNARGFRDKILEKLGTAQLEDSKVNSQDEYVDQEQYSEQYEDEE